MNKILISALAVLAIFSLSFTGFAVIDQKTNSFGILTFSPQPQTNNYNMTVFVCHHAVCTSNSAIGHDVSFLVQIGKTYHWNATFVCIPSNQTSSIDKGRLLINDTQTTIYLPSLC